MAPLKDGDIRNAYIEALGPLRRRNFVVWRPLAADWLRENLDDWLQVDVAKLMYDYIKSGGEIDQVVETRPPWKYDHDFRYDVRPSISGRKIYLETVLDEQAPGGPTILIVNMKYA
jgi:hypothetical protein